MKNSWLRSHSTLIAVLFFLALCFRLYLCTEVPLMSPDCFRNLLFSSHTFDPELKIYEVTANHFLEPWAYIWGDVKYLYPPLTLLFFTSVAKLGLGLFWVKVLLTLLDFASALIFARMASPLIGLLFFLAPTSIFWTSVEGQSEAISTLFHLLFFVALFRRRYFWMGIALMLSLQAKHWGVFLLPALCYGLWTSPGGRLRNAALAAGGFFAASLPFLGFYRDTPSLWFGVWQRPEVLLNYFSWIPSWPEIPEFTDHVWVFLLYSAASAALVLFTAWHIWKDRARRALFLPLLCFLATLKSVALGWFWYWNVVPGFLLPWKDKRGALLLAILVFASAGIDAVMNIAGKPPYYKVEAKTRLLMEQCMFRCEISALKTP